MKRHILLFFFAALSLAAWSQEAKQSAKLPTLMVVPSNTWCSEHGYMQSFENQGAKVDIPDYEAALNHDADLLNVVAKIGELMSERGFPLKDLSQSLRSLRQDETETEMLTSSTTGSSVAESPLDRLLRRAKCDILLEVAWRVNTLGPKRSVTYMLRALDAYSNKQVAAAQGTGAPTMSFELPLLINEAVVGNMDNFVAQLKAHFSDVVDHGREVAISIRVFDNGSGLTLEDEYEDKELSEWIEDWMAAHTVGQRFSLMDATETMMNFEQVRIPLFNEHGRAIDARAYVNELRKYIKTRFDITSKLVTKGLGRADLILGEK